MTPAEVGVICKYIVGNWPSMAVTTEALEVYRLELEPLDFDAALSALRVDFADDAFAPPPMKLRNAVLRRARPAISYEQAMSELLDAIASVGRYSPEPAWSDPAIGEIVRHRGGWTEVCSSTPARAAVDPAGLNAFNTWSAQFRDQFRVVAARSDRDGVHAALTGAAALELMEG